MHLVFLIPLTTAILASFIFKDPTDNEIGYLTGLATIVGLILSLVLAPWQLQLLVLIFVTIVTGRLLRQNDYSMTLENNKQEHERV